MKILLPTDGSKNALRAVKYAVRLSKLTKDPVSVTLISVHDDAALRHAQRFVGKKAVDEYLRDLCEADMIEARRVLDRAGVKHDMIIRTGHVASEIAKAGADGKYEMIVLGSKGRSALKNLLLGSIATQVAALSAIPVLLVR
ncbi:MAG TPA: universal stress protein [Burkholderiaceae bacterium]